MANIRVINPWSVLSPVWDDVSDMTNKMFSTVPAVNVYEENDMVHVEMEVPGYTPENLDITVTGDILKVTGKASDKIEDNKDRRYYMSEIADKSFTRTVTLPYEVVAEEAKADFKNGVLKLTIPKSEKAKPKSITINAS